MALARMLLVAALVGGALTAGSTTAAAAPAPPEEVVVEFAAGSTPEERSAAVEAAGATLVNAIGDGRFAVVEAPAGADLTAVEAIVDTDAPVVLHALGVPNDPGYPQQWHLTAVQAERAWDAAVGRGTVVAVIDTGVAHNAPDLAGTSFTAGYDWVDDDSRPYDENGHGTHVTGTIAQSTDNGVGVAGLAHGATIMPLRVLDARGGGTDADIADAILYATANGATVINLSLGGPSGSSVLRSAVRTAAAAGVTIVAAAGNTAGPVNYPAAYDEVIAVGAVDQTLTRASFSSVGPALDLVAPGVGVVQQTFSSGSWCLCSWSGTSSAAPHVSAAAALLVSNGVTDPSAIRAALESTALDRGATGRDDQYGHGFLQVADALASVSPPTDGTETADAGATADEPTGTTDPVAPVPGRVQDIEDACPPGSVVLGQFTDVDPALVHARAIDCASRLGLASGVAPGRFEPSGAVSRAQMATFLARTLARAGVALPVTPPDAFVDDDGTAHEAASNQLAALGVVRGTGIGTFSPGAAVSRAAMASFLVAVHDLAARVDLSDGGNPFTDDDGSVHEAAIGRLAAAGIATGTAASVFSPAAEVTRAQLATFLARTLDALIDSGDAPPI